MSSTMSTREKIDAIESGTVQDALNNLKEMMHLQQQRIARLKAPAPRSLSLMSTVTSNPAGTSVFYVKSNRRWNQEFQQICENPQLQCFAKTAAVNTFYQQFATHAETEFDTLMERYLSEDPDDSEKIEWATEAEIDTGCCLSVMMLDEVATWSKECTQQAAFLAQQLMLFPRGPLVSIFPRVLVYCRGRMALVSAELPDIGRSLTVHSCPEFRYALQLTGPSLNLSPYRRALDDGSEDSIVGPTNGTAIRCFDGRYYAERLLGWFPVFPPAKGVVAGSEHTLFFRQEFFTQAPYALSPGAFRVFAARDSASHAKNARHAASNLCQDLIPAVTSEMMLSPPENGAALVERLHAAGVNLGLLPLVYVHTPAIAASTKRLIATEMVARASKHVIREAMLCRIDVMDMYDEVSELCAAVCDAERRDNTWNEQLLPMLKKKFPGFSSVIQPPLAPHDMDLARWLTRIKELLGVVFAEGVSASGTSSFHFTIERLQPMSKMFLLPPFRVGPMLYKEVGGLTPSPTTLPHIPSSVILLATRLSMEQNSDPQEAINEYVSANQKQFDSKSFAYGYALLEAGSLLLKLQRGEQAMVFLDKAIEVISSVENNSQTIGRAHLERGLAAVSTGAFKDAVKHLSKAAVTFDRAPTPPPPLPNADTPDEPQKPIASYPIPAVAPKEQLATLYEGKGLLEEAEPLYREILTTLKEVCGDVDKQVSSAINNLACNLFAQEQYTEAEGLYQEDIRISEILYDSNSPEIATSLNNLAAVYDALDRPEEAEPLYRRDLDITMKAMGSDHNNVATSRNNLATCLQKLGRLDEAEKEYENALAIRKTHCGERHASIADFLTNIGALRLAKGDPMKAKRTFEEALSIYEETMGKNHHSLRRCLDHLCNLAEAMGNDEECERYSDRLMELKRADNDIYTAQQAAVQAS